MRKTLLATVAALSLMTAMPTANAQFKVIDPANLAQNIQQVFQAIDQGIRTLRQIELALQAVTGTDFTLSTEIRAALGSVTRVLNGQVTGIVFRELESLEQFRATYPDVLDAIDSFEQLVTVVQRQSSQLLSASRLAVTTQSVSVEAIEDILANVEASLAQSQLAVGQTQAAQVGNQLSGQIATILAQMQGAQLAAQRVDALEVAQEAAREQAAAAFRARFHNADEIEYGGNGYVPQGWVTE